MPPQAATGTTTTVDPNYKVTTKDQALDLNKAFDEHFGPLTELPKSVEPKLVEPKQASEEPPKEEKPEPVVPPKEQPKPEEGPEGEPPEDKPKPGQEASVQAEPKEGQAHPDDEPDEELDQLKLHPDSRPETVTVFRQIRGMLKSEKKVAKELRERVENQTKELSSLRETVRPVGDPTVQKELEDLRTFRTKHQIFDDSGYQVAYEQPVRQLFDEIINDVKRLAPDQQAAAEWEKQIRGAGPDRLNRDYWNEGVISQCTDPLHKERLIRKISSLLEAQDKRNEFRDKMSAEPDAYEKFRQQQSADYWQNFSVEAEDEAKKLIPTLGEWAEPKDVTLAKTAQERTAWETHNKTYKEYEETFQKYLTDAATQGPRGMTRVAVAAVMSVKYKRDLDAATARLTKLQAELKSAQDELAKISSARSRVNQSAGTTTRTEVPRPKLGKSVDDAFKEFFT